MIYNSYVYLWYDAKAKLFYLGGHKGRVDDKYVCSNKMMLRAYNKRPETFKFKVLEYVNGSNNDLRKAEQRWIDKIKDTELYWTSNIYNKTVRYYNQKKYSAGGNGLANKGKKRKSSYWTKGYTKNEIDLRRKGLLSFIPFDRPKTKKYKMNIKPKPQHKPRTPRTIYNKKCVVCETDFNTYVETQKTCSKSCSGKVAWIRGTAIGGFKKGNPAWNKGLPNSQASINGKNSAAKQSQTVTGRKKQLRDDGSWFWAYPKKDE